jgi:hypothetical protein
MSSEAVIARAIVRPDNLRELTENSERLAVAEPVLSRAVGSHRSSQ